MDKDNRPHSRERSEPQGTVSGQKGESKPIEDTSIVPEDLLKDDAPKKPARTATLEEARILLSRKARNGYRAEVKALLTEFGAEKAAGIGEHTEDADAAGECGGL